MSGTIIKVSGPLVVAEGLGDANVSDVVRVGPDRLIGEILNMTGDSASIQVYEETSGLGPGAEVESSGMPMSVELDRVCWRISTTVSSAHCRRSAS